MLGYGAQYLQDYFSPWVNQNGGYVREEAPERPLTCLFTLFLKTLFSHRWRLSTVMMRRKWSNLKWGFPSCPNAVAPPISTNQQQDLEIKLKTSSSHFLPYVYRLVISTELSYLLIGTALLFFMCIIFGGFLRKTNSWSHEQKNKRWTHFSGIVYQTPVLGDENKLWMNEIVNFPTVFLWNKKNIFLAVALFPEVDCLLLFVCL